MYTAKQYAYSFHTFILGVPFSCSSHCLRRSLQYTPPHPEIHRLMPLYTIHFASHTHFEQGRGEQLLLSSVYPSVAEYIGESSKSGQYRAKNQQATTKGREDLIIEQ